MIHVTALSSLHSPYLSLLPLFWELPSLSYLFGCVDYETLHLNKLFCHQNNFFIPFKVFSVLLMISIVVVRVNLLPFNIDQLVGSSSDELTAVIHCHNRTSSCYNTWLCWLHSPLVFVLFALQQYPPPTVSLIIILTLLQSNW